ncbi:hypothetical protein OH492_27415 [Vibrio chagasii]|nr:hypothetical protein [Vibrio chagasii]
MVRARLMMLPETFGEMGICSAPAGLDLLDPLSARLPTLLNSGALLSGSRPLGKRLKQE